MEEQPESSILSRLARKLDAEISESGLNPAEQADREEFFRRKRNQREAPVESPFENPEIPKEVADVTPYVKPRGNVRRIPA